MEGEFEIWTVPLDVSGSNCTLYPTSARSVARIYNVTSIKLDPDLSLADICPDEMITSTPDTSMEFETSGTVYEGVEPSGRGESYHHLNVTELEMDWAVDDCVELSIPQDLDVILNQSYEVELSFVFRWDWSTLGYDVRKQLVPRMERPPSKEYAHGAKRFYYDEERLIVTHKANKWLSTKAPLYIEILMDLRSNPFLTIHKLVMRRSDVEPALLHMVTSHDLYYRWPAIEGKRETH
ncbi:hypothetical protein QAD02_018240 [Eretmocerus hayati]|uniref:Uncharacterized protein n=1 Tax=Eretmocerus hayati TaxID=131215 RepID=A0ACC2PG57_9HYME|nr:hypothetical protein QAD02_018240 [Eretmocerus hayati]